MATNIPPHNLSEVIKACIALIDTPDLSILNHNIGLEPIRKKLPNFVNNAWRKKRSDYLEQHGTYPKFNIFCDFLQKMSDSLCDDVLPITFPHNTLPSHNNTKTTNARVLYTSSDEKEAKLYCAFHKVDAHDTQSCTSVIQMEPTDKRAFIMRNGLCFRCLGHHLASKCREKTN